MTDVLKVLGKLASPDAGRDAIHVSIAPVVAGQILKPGEHVGWMDEERTRVGRVEARIGVIDPFLSGNVFPGQRVYLFLFPGPMLTLRHVWEHPEFPPEAAPVPPEMVEEMEELRERLADAKANIARKDSEIERLKDDSYDDGCRGCYDN